MRHLLGSTFSFGVCLAAVCHSASADRAAGMVVPDAQVHQYGSSLDSYFALSLRGEVTEQSVRNFVFVVDTSASQTGRYRDAALDLLSRMLKQLPADARVQVYAVDTTVEKLTTDAVLAGSAELRGALELLNNRTPLGATNLSSALTEVVERESGKSDTSLIYVGDGLSAGALLSTEQLATLVDAFQTKQISVHSALLGPKVDTQLMSIFANQTGGTVQTLHTLEVAGASSGLVKAALQAPVAIESLTVSAKDCQLAAGTKVLLRGDRHTVIPGSGELTDSVTVKAVDQNGRNLSWTVSKSDIHAAGMELKSIYSRATSTGGLDVSVLGTQGLDAAQAEFSRAMKAGQIQLTAAGGQVGGVQEGSANDELGASTSTEAEALRAAESKRQIKTQQLTLQVNNAIDEAKKFGATQPDYAAGLLKDIRETIAESAEINPEAKDELLRRVDSSLTNVQVASDKARLDLQQAAQREAIVEAQRKLLTESELDEERLQTLIDQVRGLLNRARHGDPNAYEDAEQVARKALEMTPGDGTATAALVMSESLGQLDKAYKLVNLRHDKFLETLYQVELSHVPFPDEPPVLYPPADVWRALTLTRKPKYESVDLRSEQPAETWLRRMLKEPAPPMDYQGETSLKEILDQVSEYYTNTYGASGGGAGADYRMTIIPDFKELEIAGISSLEDVTVKDISLQGITLKNALELIFSQTQDPELTYMIKNEVMLITTVEFAESDENLITRVYPVGDLTIPTNLHLQLGGGMGGGGGGFGGGGQGGFGGGGQGGFGGGGQGGFGGGGQGGFGGGGAFSLPPESLGDAPKSGDAGISNDAIQQLKKKPSAKK